MSATYDNVKQAVDFGVATLDSGAFTIGSGADRAAMVCLSTIGNPGAITAVSCGGQAGSTTPVASGDDGTWFQRIFKVLAPASGSQSASVTWTNSVSAFLTVITAVGASDIANPAYNENAAGNNTSLNIAANAGDLTASFSGNGNTDTVAASNQTQRISGTEIGADTGPGTAGPITHTWTHTGNSAVNAIGATFIAAGGGTNQALDGAAAGSGTAAGALDHGVPLAGDAAGAGTASGAITHGVPLQGGATGAGAAAAELQVPTLTLPALKNNAGTPLANEAGATLYIHALTGALLATKASLSTDGSGVMAAITDAALVSGTTYRCVIVLASGAEGMIKVAAA